MTLSLDQKPRPRRSSSARATASSSFGLLTEKSKITPSPGVTAANLFE